MLNKQEVRNLAQWLMAVMVGVSTIVVLANYGHVHYQNNYLVVAVSWLIGVYLGLWLGIPSAMAKAHSATVRGVPEVVKALAVIAVGVFYIACFVLPAVYVLKYIDEALPTSMQVVFAGDAVNPPVAVFPPVTLLMLLWVFLSVAILMIAMGVALYYARGKEDFSIQRRVVYVVGAYIMGVLSLVAALVCTVALVGLIFMWLLAAASIVSPPPIKVKCW